MRFTCGTGMKKTRFTRRMLDAIRFHHTTHTCVQINPLHVGTDHICQCGTKWPWISVKIGMKYS